MGVLDFLKGGSAQDRFAQQVMKQARKLNPDHDLTYDRDRFAIAWNDRSMTLSLGVIFEEWRQVPESERDAIVAGAARMLRGPAGGTTYDAVSANLLPVIRNRSHMETLKFDPAIPQAAKGFTGAMTPLADHLAVLIAIDEADSMTMVTAEKLDSWGVSFDDCLATAVENLRAQAACRFERYDDGFYVSSFGDDYDASRLLIPSGLALLPLAGDPVAVAASRSCLVVAGSDDPRALIAMAEFVEETMREVTRPISFAPIILRSGGWRPYEPEQEALGPLRRLAILQKIWDQSEQRRLLGAWLPSQGRKDVVAELIGLEGDQFPHTWTSYSQGEPALLPRADLLVFRTADADFQALWNDVEATYGPFELEPGTWPHLYRISGEAEAALARSARSPRDGGRTDA